jgi:hypothetical protein
MSIIVLEELKLDGTWEPREVEIDLEADFHINEDDVDGELCRAGKILSFYGDLAANLRAQAQRKKDLRDQVNAFYAIELRNSGEKMTEGSIKEKILANKESQEAQAEYIKSEMFATKAELLFKSQMKKVDCLTALTYKQRVEIQRNAF